MATSIDQQIQELQVQKDELTKSSVIADTKTIQTVTESMNLLYQKTLSECSSLFRSGLQTRLLEASNYRFISQNGSTFLKDLNSDMMYKFLLEIAKYYKPSILQ